MIFFYWEVQRVHMFQSTLDFPQYMMSHTMRFTPKVHIVNTLGLKWIDMKPGEVITSTVETYQFTVVTHTEVIIQMSAPTLGTGSTVTERQSSQGSKLILNLSHRTLVT